MQWLWAARIQATEGNASAERRCRLSRCRSVNPIVQLLLLLLQFYKFLFLLELLLQLKLLLKMLCRLLHL